MTVTLGILAVLEAKAGNGDELAAFLKAGRELAVAEAGTVTEQVVDDARAVVLGRVDGLDSSGRRAVEHADGRCPVRPHGWWRPITGRAAHRHPSPSVRPTRVNSRRYGRRREPLRLQIA